MDEGDKLLLAEIILLLAGLTGLHTAFRIIAIVVKQA
jgi:hypothetical protein